MIYIEPNSEKWLSLDDLPNERWQDINHYKGLYQISNYGRVKSLDRIIKSKRYHKDGYHRKEHIMKVSDNGRGYLFVRLSKNNSSLHGYLHKLVAQAFIPNLENKPQINHKDGNKHNNNATNLEWCTNGENGQHAWDNNLRTRRFGTDNYASRKVIQFTLDYKPIKIWNCISDVEKIYGFSHSDISKNCRYKSKTCHNYLWRYYEEVKDDMDIQ